MLPYDVVREADSPHATLLAFLAIRGIVRRVGSRSGQTMTPSSRFPGNAIGA